MLHSPGRSGRWKSPEMKTGFSGAETSFLGAETSFFGAETCFFGTETSFFGAETDTGARFSESETGSRFSELDNTGFLAFEVLEVLEVFCFGLESLA